MNKTAIKNFAIWARVQLIESAKQRAFEYEITENGENKTNVDSVGGRVLSNEEKQQRRQLIEQIRKKGYTQVMEEAAYTWFNRFIALRFMEVNGYLPSKIRVFTDENGVFKPEILKEAMSVELEGLDKNKVLNLIDKQDNEELYKYLLITQCNALNAGLPYMFEKIANPTELLFPANLLRNDSVVGQMISEIPEEDWTDQVQIIGWLYQYYNTEPKDKVFADLKKNIKISKENIPAATQLFTPDWIVHYMVENSIGRLWVEGHPNDEMKASWKYYLEEAEQEPDVQRQLETIRAEYAQMKPEDIRVIDPCMGSGHILVVMFDVLVQIYEAYGYSAREAASMIVEHNLYGLDIDERAAQLSYFAVMMKARQYDRRFFSRKVQPHVYAIVESNDVDSFTLEYFVNGDANIKKSMNILMDELRDAKEYGSILNVTMVDFPALYARLAEVEEDISMHRESALNTIKPLIQVAEALAQKYNVTCTNPPYMGNKGFSTKLLDYITKHYYEGKIDLFAPFICKCSKMIVKGGKYCLITPDSWMFLSRFEKLRIPYLKENTFDAIMHLGFGAFDSGFGTVAFTGTSHISDKYNATCIRLVDYQTSAEKKAAFATERRIISDSQKYNCVKGSPICYWASTVLLENFNNKTICELGSNCVGLVTGNNERFLRLWHEIDDSVFGHELPRSEAIKETSLKWFPINQCGDYRKWYGNNVEVFDWWHNGHNIKQFKLDRYLRGEAEKKNSKCWNEEAYFKEGLTWSRISTDRFSARLSVEGCTAGTTCPIYFPSIDKYYMLGLLNSKVIGSMVSFLNPTVSFQAADIERIPVSIVERDLPTVRNLVEANLKCSKADWDFYETSWNFKCHPMLNCGKLADAYAAWKADCESRFLQLKANEEELNRIFIGIYGLQDELTPDVADKDVTVHRVFDTKDDVPESMKGSNYVRTMRDEIVSLISYAVGCMFGRYSLDVDGLAYAGGDWDASKYTTFPADKDNIIPICDDEYFDDDIVGKFIDFVRKVYGDETLEENLRFIADALGGKGTSREVIRSYFLNDFYSDHLKTYQKRPIYWQFDSGKKNGFKALIYMHRYQPDLLARMRTDYVHEQQERYRTQLQMLEDSAQTAAPSERVKLNKQITKLKDQSLEIQKYEEKIHHLADQMIEIDLDDGVKVNYAKFEDVLAKIK